MINGRINKHNQSYNYNFKDAGSFGSWGNNDSEILDLEKMITHAVTKIILKYVEIELFSTYHNSSLFL